MHDGRCVGILMCDVISDVVLCRIGNLEEAVGHYVSFIQFSSNPRSAMATLQQLLPPPVFNIVIQALAAVARQKVSLITF